MRWTGVWRWLPAAAILVGSVSLALAGHGTPGSVITRYPDEVKRLLEARQPVVLIDVRPEGAYRQGHVPGARNVPFADLGERLGEIPQSGPVILYGDTRFDARRVHDFLRARGYDNLSVLEDGFIGWARRGLPVQR
jgi:rhodanese-related sulfurtransferase